MAPFLPLLDVPEAARLCGVSDALVRRLIKKGEIAASKIGGRVKVWPNVLLEYIQQTRIKPAATPTPTPPRSRAQVAAAIDWRSEYERLRR